MELSPGSFRTFVVGTSYQLGNLVSSASSTIEATIGERFPLSPLKAKNGKVTKRYEYGKVICIFMGAVFLYVILLTFVGPERRGRSMHADDDSDLIEAAGEEVVRGVVGRHGHHAHGEEREVRRSESASEEDVEKGRVGTVEKA